MTLTPHITHTHIAHGPITGILTKNHQVAITVPHRVKKMEREYFEAECPLYVEVPGFNEYSAQASGNSIRDNAGHVITFYVTRMKQRPGLLRLRVIYDGRIVSQGIVMA